MVSIHYPLILFPMFIHSYYHSLFHYDIIYSFLLIIIHLLPFSFVVVLYIFMCLLLRFLNIVFVLTVVFPVVYSNEFTPEPTGITFLIIQYIVLLCDEECVHGVCDTNTLTCNCTVFYTGNLCDTLTDATKISISVVLLLLAAIILFYLCCHNRNRSTKKYIISFNIRV